MEQRALLQREIYDRYLVNQVTFWFTRDDVYDGEYIRHISMITEIILEVIRTHEAVDTGYPFVLGTARYTRKEAFKFVKALSERIDVSRKRGNSDYVIEWWNRGSSDAGRDYLIISIAPPGICELSM